MVHKHWPTYILQCKWFAFVHTVKYVTIFVLVTFSFSVSVACTATFVDLQVGYTHCLLCTHRSCWFSLSSCSLCMSLHRTLYHTLLDGRANFIYFNWPLWRGSVIVYLCILWRSLVTWIHANVLTTPLMRKLF